MKRGHAIALEQLERFRAGLRPWIIAVSQNSHIHRANQIKTILWHLGAQDKEISRSIGTKKSPHFTSAASACKAVLGQHPYNDYNSFSGGSDIAILAKSLLLTLEQLEADEACAI